MPEPAMLDYFYGDEAEQYTFYRIPKVLFTDPAYRRISSDAKILYGLMLDRMGLSVRNGWLDDCQRVFIYFTLEDALEYLCCGHTKAVSLFGELDKGGLIERKKQGQGKPTKIYVKNFVRKAEVLTSKKRKSKVPQTGSQDFQKTASNNTEINNTDLNETDPSIYPVRGLPEDRPPAAADEMDTMEAYREVIKENIEYDIMRQQLGYNADLLDDILDIMVDTVCSSKRMIRIGGEDYPREVVKNRLLKINGEHIGYVIDCLKENTTKVRNIRAYLLTSLYNAPTTINSYYTALVNHDLYGDDFWQKAEALLYQALIAYIYYEAPAEEKNMNTLLDMLNACECREDDENFKSAVDLLFEQLENRTPDHFAVRQYKKFKMAAGDICSK